MSNNTVLILNAFKPCRLISFYLDEKTLEGLKQIHVEVRIYYIYWKVIFAVVSFK